MTIKDIYDSLNEEQKDLVSIVVSIAVRDKEKEKNREIGAFKRKIRKLEKTIENRKTATNQDKIAEMVRTMDPKRLADRLQVEFDCYTDCPCEEECKKNRREPCPAIICEWLKKEVKEDK